MTAVHGRPAAHLVGWLRRARTDRARLATAGLGVAEVAELDLDDPEALWRTWWHDPDVPGLRQLLRDAADALAAGDLDRAHDARARLDLDRAARVDGDPAGAVIAVRDALRLRAAHQQLVEALADGPDLTGAFEAARRPDEHDTDAAAPLGESTTAEDLRRAVLLAWVAGGNRPTSTVAGYPLVLGVADGPWADHQVDPLPAGAPVPGGTVDRTGTAGAWAGPGVVAFDDPALAALQPAGCADQIVDPYDWARAQRPPRPPEPGVLPPAVVGALESVAALADDPDHRRLRAGIRSERQVSRTLRDIDGLVALVDGPVVDGGDADHVVLGPWLAVVETKTGRGRLALDTAGDRTQLLVDGRPLRAEDGSALGQVLRQARALEQHVAATTGRRVTVDAVLCVTAGTGGPLVADVDGRTVRVCSRRQLPGVVAGLPARLDVGTALTLARRLAALTGD